MGEKNIMCYGVQIMQFFIFLLLLPQHTILEGIHLDHLDYALLKRSSKTLF